MFRGDVLTAVIAEVTAQGEECLAAGRSCAEPNHSRRPEDKDISLVETDGQVCFVIWTNAAASVGRQVAIDKFDRI
eukprot:1094600-Pyramimonas_sp.AAC.1